MNLLEVLRTTFATFRAHKMRSFLTMFGIVWGIASVILLVGLGKGFSRQQKENWKALGTDLVIMWGGRTSAQVGGLAAGREIPLTIEDARLIEKECYRVRQVSPELTRSLPETSAFNSANLQVTGIWPSYQDFRSLAIGEGRAIMQRDEDQEQRVVILGYEARQQLFSGQPAVGAQLSIRGVPYTVVGVLEKKKQNSDYNGRDNRKLYVPYSAMARDFPMEEKPKVLVVKGQLSNVVLAVANPEEHEEAVAQVRAALGRVHHFDPQDKDAIFIWDTMEMSKMIMRIFDVMTIFFGTVAVLTLCLGGIGVMNIMLVTVSERTREIGVRKAIGATRSDILRQFFAESAAITGISGVLGFSLGLGACVALQKMPAPDFFPRPFVSTAAVIASVLTLSLITVTAGMYPAQRAANMEPVESLRYE